MKGLTVLGGIGLLVVITSCLGWTLAREVMGRSITQHWIAEALHVEAQEWEWTVLVDETRRPGWFEPIILAALGGQPWKRTLVWDTGAAPSATGPLVEELLLGAPGAPPEGPVQGVIWRASRASLLSLDPEVPKEVWMVRPQRSFIGKVQDRTFLRRAETLRVTVTGRYLVLITEGGRKPRSMPAEPHPLRSTEPFRWDHLP